MMPAEEFDRTCRIVFRIYTVKMGVYEDYDRTNRFYLACGFKEFEVIETIWDEANPCQIYVMSLA